ncbi:hypothetical protein GCM10011316_14550 [Roseibium aquae]|uniref:Uncharacterized protein n=1 Tax=Roseibium aquae TaxID=1323746 RepID=A0A916TGI1_9HYPH|nr:hypothetical protein [Roseibium aquae]GGB43702.1 hypothetical protein GCM10011316_14550 [Roseibium aquae]
MNVIDLPLAQIIPYARNPRRNEKAIATVAASIAEFAKAQDEVYAPGHRRRSGLLSAAAYRVQRPMRRC